MSGILGGIAGNLAGGNIGRAVVSLALDTTGYNAQLEKTQAETTAATGGMSAGVDKFSGVAVAAFITAGAAAAKFAEDSVKAAIDANEQQLKLATSIANSTKVTSDSIPAFQAQAQAIRDLTGVDDDAINGMQGFLIQMGLNQKQVTSLTPLVVDLSQKMGITLTNAAKAVGKSVNGQATSLTRMGIVVDKTAESTDAYSATLTALGAVQGFAAAKADAEPWILLEAQFRDMEQQIGRDLLPAVEDLAKAANPLLRDAITAVDDVLGPFIRDLATVAQGLQYASDHTEAWGGVLGGLIHVDVGGWLSKYGGGLLGIFHQTQDVAQVTDGWKSKMDAATHAVLQATAASKKHAQALRDERAAEEQLTGGLIGLIGDQEALNSAEAAANKLREQGKQGTLAYHDAVANVLTAQQQFNSDLHTQAQEMRQQGIPLADIKTRLEGIGKQAGLTKAQVDQWITGMKGAQGLLDNLTGKTHVIDVQVNISQTGAGLPPAIQQELQRRLALGLG